VNVNDEIEREILAYRLQSYLLAEHDLLVSVQALEGALMQQSHPEIEAEIREYREAERTVYTLTDLGEAYRRAMGSKLNGAVKAGDPE